MLSSYLWPLAVSCVGLLCFVTLVNRTTFSAEYRNKIIKEKKRKRENPFFVTHSIVKWEHIEFAFTEHKDQIVRKLVSVLSFYQLLWYKHSHTKSVTTNSDKQIFVPLSSQFRAGYCSCVFFLALKESICSNAPIKMCFEQK